DDEDFKIYSLPIKEFHKLVQLKGREHYTQIKRIIKKLMEKTIEIPRADGGYLITHWATHVEYLAGKGTIQFSFEPKLKPYLLRSEEHTSELQSRFDLVCRLLLEKKKIHTQITKVSNTS